jgi:glycosyltransferase involved in cell wall biosynthesis
MSTAGLRVLHVLAPAPAGGAETVVRSLVAGQAARGPYVGIAALLQTPGESPFVRQAREQGLSVTEIRCGRRRYHDEAAVVAELIRSLRIDLVHSHVVHANFVALRATRSAGVPVVATAHGFTGGDWKNRLYDWLDPVLLRRFDGVIAVSRPLRDLLLGRGCRPERLYLLPNAFRPGPLLPRTEARRLLGLPEDIPAIGWVGRLTPEKGPDLLLDALAAGPGLDAATVFIGEGPMRAGLEAGVASRRIDPKRVHFAGRREGAGSLLRAFDAVVLSSRTEGTPMALLEAMAAGVPVVAFAVGGIPQVLDSRSGWLVPSLDPLALAGAIRQVLAAPPEAAARARAAQEILSERFSPEQWLDDVEAIYRRALASGAPS